MEVDRISMLPDEVLYHILSFLPTQMAAATSVLSKRWKPLWLSVPALFFDDRSYLLNDKPYLYFTKLIYATILTRDVPIRTFRLQCEASHFNFSVSELNIWVNAAIKRGLENLYIRLPRNQLSWSSCIFSCKTLVVLELVGLEDLDVISFAHLPSLKTLHLIDVAFIERQDLVSFADLPSLKTLDVKDAHFPGRQYLVDLLAGCPNLEYMHLWVIYYDVECIPCYKNFKSLSKLVKADIHAIGFDIFVESPEFDKYLDDIPLFPNLTHAELMLGFDMSWDLVLAILKHCPMLQNVVLDMQTHYAYYKEPVWISPCFVPECLSSQLRTCDIINSEVKESELHFAKYILQNSRVLGSMTIWTRGLSELKVDKLELLNELSLCPRSSTICELSFI